MERHHSPKVGYTGARLLSEQMLVRIQSDGPSFVLLSQWQTSWLLPNERVFDSLAAHQVSFEHAGTVRCP
jgi:hypothetical protein